MSAASATLIAGGLTILETLLGIVVGLFAERYLRSRGEVWCETELLRWKFTYFMREPRKAWSRSMTGFGPLGRGDVAQAISVESQFSADFYNGRELPTGLRSFEVLFHRPDDLPMRSHPQDGLAWRTENVGSTAVGSRTDPLKVLNLPPKQFVSLEVRRTVPDTTRLVGCNLVELRAVFPDGATSCENVARFDPGARLVGG